MNDTEYTLQGAILLRHIEAIPSYHALKNAVADKEAIESDSLSMIFDAAGRFAEEVLYPVNRHGDVQGCRLEAGRVLTADGYRDAWKEFVEQGWNSVDQPVEYGGQGLPSFVNVACREMFDRACMAFGMIAGPQRAATLVLKAFAEPALCDEWVTKFVEGAWSASIGISEADAGSDVGRIRTRAVPLADGAWEITGEKMWTSFGDNDMVERIGCMLLARTPDAPPGTGGLSLFLVPNTIQNEAGEWVQNGVIPRRLEEKLGLHGSPTCAMGFENSRGTLIGSINRGVSQLFVMIQNMRVLVAIEGVGMAYGAAKVAHDYAMDRRQGGDPREPAVRICEHAEIQRLLLNMHSRVEVLRALVLDQALRLDLMPYQDEADRTESNNVVQWMLPILKACCSEAGFDVANDAIQILGGAGYTREWPVEQWLRDARMMSIAEGASGIQALDLLHRRLWRDNGAGLSSFLVAAREEIATGNEEWTGPATAALAILEDAGERLIAMKQAPRDAEAGATAFLKLAMLAATGWSAVRLSRLSGDPIADRLAAAGRYWLSDLEARARREFEETIMGAGRLALFEAL